MMEIAILSMFCTFIVFILWRAFRDWVQALTQERPAGRPGEDEMIAMEFEREWKIIQIQQLAQNHFVRGTLRTSGLKTQLVVPGGVPTVQVLDDDGRVCFSRELPREQWPQWM